MKTYLILGCVMALAVTPVFSADSPQNKELQSASTEKPGSASKHEPATDNKQKLSFKEIDTDGDGYISPVEAYVAGFEVEPMDTDKDGRLSEQEYQAANVKTDESVASKGQSEDASRSPDKAAAESHLSESLGQPATAPESDHAFKDLDSDGDGVISKEEAAVAGLNQKDIDTDGDGKISKEEYEANQADARKKQEAGGKDGNATQSARAGE